LWTSADGITKACEVFETPVISGNVSLYNETSGKSIYPTPVIGMVGLIEELSHVTTSHFKKEGDKIFLVGQTKGDFNGSELQKMHLGRIEGRLFEFDLAYEKHIQDLVLKAIQGGLVESAHDLSEGGLAIALAESAFKHELGVKVQVKMPKTWLFSETQSRFLLSVNPEKCEEILAHFGKNAVSIGTVTQKGRLLIQADDGKVDINVIKAKKLWEGSLSCL
jgi:phosphoribosylformylglycinamidine synthase